MKLATWKRTVLGAVVAVSVAGAALATVAAGQASAHAEPGCLYDSVRGIYTCYMR